MILKETKKIIPDFRTILESTDEMICAFDKNYQLLYCNNSFIKTIKMFLDIDIKEGDIISEFPELINYGDYASIWESIYKKSFSGEKCFEDINFKIGEILLTYKLKILPIIEEDEVSYIQITAKEEVENYISKDEIETFKVELLTNKQDLIEERDNALKILLDNTERWQMVMEGSDNVFWDWNFENDSIFYSPNQVVIFNLTQTPKENNFNSWRENIHPNDVERVVETLHEHMEGVTDKYFCEYRIKTIDNTWCWVLDKGKVAIRDENNYPIRLAGTISEITQRKESELLLKESEERFASMSNDLPVMIWLMNNKLKPIYVNELTKSFFGSLDLEDPGNLENSIHKDDYQFFKFAVLEVYKTKEKTEIEIRIKNVDQEYRWVLTTIVPRFDSEKNLVGFLGVGLDITERKYAEMQVLESERQFNEITSVVGEGLFVIDDKGSLQFTNPEFKKLLGWRKEELEGKTISDFLEASNDNEYENNSAIQEVIKNGKQIRIKEDYFYNKEGKKLPVSYVSAPIKRSGKVVGCVTAFHDITEEKKINEETQRYVKELKFNKELMRQNAVEFGKMNEMLIESEERLKELNGSKDKFFTIISHDLRSPFTSITGFSEVMMEDIDTLSKEDIKDFATSIHRTSKNVHNLLENLLHWSRIQTGRIDFTPNLISLNEQIDETIALYEVNAARKRISLINNIDEDYFIKADKFMLNTIIRNLVSNSIKFTKQGGEISVNAMEIKEEKKIEISIEDTGIGMSKEIQEKLFKIDEHITTKGTEKEKGTGIGLILCKEFVEKHKGNIWVESEIGVGSKFEFTLQID
ncbi:MAG: PAS domain S-box protein [Ignavibacteriae bacterium]|nr:PAS domain S-box protein [Ignavibacteriota bacterium]